MAAVTIEAGLDTVRLYTHLGGNPLKAKYWFSEKRRFLNGNGTSFTINRSGYPGISIEGSLPKLVNGTNNVPAGQLEALQGVALLIAQTTPLFENHLPDLRDWNVSRADVALDFMLPMESGDIEELAEFACPSPNTKIRVVGGESKTIYLRDTSDSNAGSSCLVLYVKEAGHLRCEWRAKSPALRQYVKCREAIGISPSLEYLIPEAYKRFRRAFKYLIPPDDPPLNLESVLSMHGVVAERLDEHQAALTEMTISDLLRISPIKEWVRRDMNYLAEKGFRAKPIVRPSVRMFADVLVDSNPPPWRPY